MKILFATDAWYPPVVRTLERIADETAKLDAKIEFFTLDPLSNLPMPSYPEVRLTLPCGGKIARGLARIAPRRRPMRRQGPLGCLARRLPFTTSFHTWFPEYIAGHLPVPVDGLARLTSSRCQLLNHSHGYVCLNFGSNLAASMSVRDL